MAPPSTTRLVPVTNLDASEARYKAAHPISSGCPNFFMGVLPIIRCALPGSSALEYLNIGVSVHPGTIALNRMPVPDSSYAKERIMPSVPDLAMEYPSTPVTPMNPVSEERNITLPPFMWGTDAFVRR